MTERSLMQQFEQAVEHMLRGEKIMLAPDPELGALLGIASDLRDMPRITFLSHLKTQLAAQGASMTTTATQPVREGFRTITPYIVVPDALGLVDFLQKAFGAQETLRSTGSGGGYHIEVRIGDTMIMVGGGGDFKGTPMPTALHLYVPDVDAAHQRAIAAGATQVMPPGDREYGDRDSALKDPYGNEWYLATHKGDTYIRPGLTAVTPYLHPPRADELIRFLQRAFNADPFEVDIIPEENNRVAHAKLKIGDSILELGEAHGPWQNMPTMFLLYVDDSEAWYKHAIDHEAIPMFPPTDQPYGRVGAVRDGWDNQYYISTPNPPDQK